MIPVNPTYAPLQAFVDELARCGMTHAVTSPGSRNAPLSLTLAGDPRLRTVSVLAGAGCVAAVFWVVRSAPTANRGANVDRAAAVAAIRDSA